MQNVWERGREGADRQGKRLVAQQRLQRQLQAGIRATPLPLSACNLETASRAGGSAEGFPCRGLPIGPSCWEPHSGLLPLRQTRMFFPGLRAGVPGAPGTRLPGGGWSQKHKAVAPGGGGGEKSWHVCGIWHVPSTVGCVQSSYVHRLSFNPHNNPAREALLLPPFNGRGNGGTERSASGWHSTPDRLTPAAFAAT